MKTVIGFRVWDDKALCWASKIYAGHQPSIRKRAANRCTRLDAAWQSKRFSVRECYDDGTDAKSL